MVKRLLLSLILGIFLIGSINAWSIDITRLNDNLPINYYSENVTNLYYQLTSINCSEVSDVIFSNDGGLNNISNGACAVSGGEIKLSNLISNQGNNSWTIFILNNSGYVELDTIGFWIDSIAPVITLNYPLTNPIYLSQDNFNINVTIRENNPSRIQFKVTAGSSLTEERNYFNNTAEVFRFPSFGSVPNENYTFTITANDSLNHISVQSGIIILDTIAPNIFLTNPQNGENKSEIISIASSANDERSGIASILVNISQGALSNSTICSATCNFDWNSAEFNDGQVNISSTTTDLAGNSNSTAITIEIDNTNPQINFNNPINGEYSTNQLINITASDAHLSKIELYVNGNLSNSTTQTTLLHELGEGNYSIYAKGYDYFGNSNIAETRNILIDLTAPVITLLGNNPQIIELGSTYSELGATADDNFAGNVTSNIIQDSSSVNTNAEGSYIVTYFVNDSVNNIATINRTIIVNDTTAPIVTITASSPENNKGYANGTNFIINYTATDLSNISNCYLIFDDLINPTGFNLNDISIGSHNYSVVCNDSSSNANIGSSGTRIFTINSANENIGLFNESTNLSEELDISNVYYFFVSNAQGSINFTGSIDFSTGFDWSKYINISSNRIEVNSTGAPQLNTSAIITLHNITWITPQILVNGLVCSSPVCNILSFNATSGTLIFNVTGFSIYSTQETPVSSPSSSGGGGSSYCSTTWSCTAWSTCDSGVQIRTCSKVNPSCSADPMPSLTQSCTLPESNSTIEELTLETIPEASPEPSGPGITGAVIGSNVTKGIVGSLVFLAVIILTYLGIKRIRKSKVREVPSNPFRDSN